MRKRGHAVRSRSHEQSRGPWRSAVAVSRSLEREIMTVREDLKKI
jgi:hypothetical protein